MDLLVPSLTVGAVLSAVFWMASAFLVRDRIDADPFLHLITVYLTILSFILFDAFTVSSALGWLSRTAVILLYSFAMGVQLTGGVAAFLFVRSIKRRAQ